MEDIEEIEQEQTDYSLFLNKKNLSYVPKIIKNQINDVKNDDEKQESIVISLNNLKKVISDSHVVSSRNLSLAKWDYSLNVAIVTIKHGNSFETMGKMINGQLTLFPEETLFLIEKGSLQLIEENDKGEEYPLSIQQTYSIIYSIPSFSFEKYRVYSYLKRLGYIILEHDKNTSNTINVTFNDDKLQNINKLTISSDSNIEISLFSKEKLTNYVNIFSQKMREIENSKFISSTACISNICKKGIQWFDKLFTVPFSLAFDLETNSKIEYFKSRNDYTQPLYNYYDDKNLETVYSKISIIPYYHSNLNSATNNNDNSVVINYDVYKPNGQYTKKNKSLPDFYLIVQSCLNDFPHFTDFMAIINERNEVYDCYSATLNTVNTNPSQNSKTKTKTKTKTNSNSNSNSNSKPKMSNNKKGSNKISKNKNKTEIKLAMVNAANITFADVDNEYIRLLHK